MHRPGTKIACKLLFLLLVMYSCKPENKKPSQQLPYYNDPAFTALWVGEDHFMPDTIHRIESFAFTDQDNHAVTNQTFEGKVYIANFFFAGCGSICPKMTTNLNKVADTFKNEKDVLFLSHSVTPERDSVPVLKQFAERYHIDSKQWHLVTGKSEQINAIARRSYFIEKAPGLSKDSTEFLHTENMVLIDRKGHIRGLYKGTLEFDTNRMIEDINVLLKE